jgi:hypothetical protein
MPDTLIGVWVARHTGERQLTRWHRVESDVAEDVVTKCGRRMVQRSERGILLMGDGPDRCARCR